MSSLLVRRRSKPSINIVPLMDVLTILIFFFLVSMQFRDIEAIKVSLPEMRSSEKVPQHDELAITMDAEGILYFEEMELNLDSLAATLASLAEGDRAGNPVVLRVDKKTDFERVTELLDVCRMNGFRQIRFQSR